MGIYISRPICKFPFSQLKMPRITMFGLQVLLVLISLGFSAGNIPDYIHICKSSDPEISKCITNSINQLKPKFKTGIPELDVPSLEPFILDTIALRRGFQSNITDLKVYGVSNIKITEVKVNIPNNRFFYKIFIPSLEFAGHYELDMKILFLNIRGRGPIYGNITNYYAEGLMMGNKILQNGEEYLKFDKMKLRVRFDTIKLRLENLFNGDPLLGQATNNIINENTDIFINEIKPALENGLAERLTEIANKITLKFTYKELFP